MNSANVSYGALSNTLTHNPDFMDGKSSTVYNNNINTVGPSYYPYRTSTYDNQMKYSSHLHLQPSSLLNTETQGEFKFSVKNGSNFDHFPSHGINARNYTAINSNRQQVNSPDRMYMPQYSLDSYNSSTTIANSKGITNIRTQSESQQDQSTLSQPFRADRRKNQSLLSGTVLSSSRSGKEDIIAIERRATTNALDKSNVAQIDRLKQNVLLEYQRAMVLYDKAQYESALVKFKESLSSYFKAQLDDAEMCADIYLGMGISYQALGDDESAIDLYTKSIDTLEARFGKHYPGVVSALVNTGIIYTSQKKYDEAIKIFMKAQKLAENVLGSQRIGLADIYHNIGVIYDEQSRLSDALTFYDKSIRIREKIVGNSHPIIAMVYENMAQILKDQGEFKKAIDLQTKVLSIRKKHLGTNHLDYALALHNMGIILFKEKRYGQASEYFTKAHTIRQSQLGEEHNATRCSLQLFEESSKRSNERRKKISSMSTLYSNSKGTINSSNYQ